MREEPSARPRDVRSLAGRAWLVVRHRNHSAQSKRDTHRARHRHAHGGRLRCDSARQDSRGETATARATANGDMETGRAWCRRIPRAHAIFDRAEHAAELPSRCWMVSRRVHRRSSRRDSVLDRSARVLCGARRITAAHAARSEHRNARVHAARRTNRWRGSTSRHRSTRRKLRPRATSFAAT